MFFWSSKSTKHFNSYSKVTLLEKFYDENPNIVLRINYATTYGCFKAIRSGEADAMISSQVYRIKDGAPKLDFGDDIKITVLAERSVYLAMGEYYRPKNRDSFTMADLQSYTFITHIDSLDTLKIGEDERPIYFQEACKANGFTPKLLYVGNPEDIKDIIALQGRGVYLSTAPEKLRHTPGICYIPITDAGFKVQYYMLSMKDNQNKAIEKLEKAAVPLFKEDE